MSIGNVYLNLNEQFDFKLQFRSRLDVNWVKNFSPNQGLEVGGGYVSHVHDSQENNF